MTGIGVLNEAVAHMDRLRDEAIQAMAHQDLDRVAELFEELDVASVIVRTILDSGTNSGSAWLAQMVPR